MSVLYVKNSQTGEFERISPTGENITSVKLDETLSKEGMAADAKATGDALASLNGEITNLQNIIDSEAVEYIAPLTIIEGKYIYQYDGTVNSSKDWFCCDFVDVSEAIDNKVSVTTILCNEEYRSTAWYDADKKFIGSLHSKNAADYGISLSWQPQTFTLTLPSNAAYIRASGRLGSFTPDQMVIKYNKRLGGSIVQDVNDLIEDVNALQQDVEPIKPKEKLMTKKLSAIDMSAGESVQIATTAAGVYHAGKNIFAISGDATGNSYAGAGHINSIDTDKQIIWMTVKNAGEAYVIRKLHVPVDVGDKVTISTVCTNQHGNPATPILRALNANYEILTDGVKGGAYNTAYGGFLGDATGEAMTYEITGSDIKYIDFGFGLRYSNGVNNGDIVGMRCQVEVGDKATEWESCEYKIYNPSNTALNLVSVDGINTFFAIINSALTIRYADNKYASAVNGKTGNVVLTAKDVGALPVGWEGYNDIVHRNADMWQAVNACARYGNSNTNGWNQNKQFTMMLTTDVHNDLKRFQNAIDYMDASAPIDCGFSLGDIQMNAFSDNDGTWFTDAINAANKKMYPVIGNHDCGMSKIVGVAGSKQEQFNKFFAPVIDKLELDGLTTTYYTFTHGNVTVIVLDGHDVPDTLVSDTEYEFRHGSGAYSQVQLDWLVQTLANIPVGNHLLILVHDMPEIKTLVECNFSNEDYVDSEYPYRGMIPEIVDAWQKGAALSKTYSPAWDSGLGSRTINADFTGRGEGVFAGYIHGHRHQDFVTKITAFPEQNCIALTATLYDTSGNAKDDFPRVINTRSEDAVTVATVDTIGRQIKLVRIGSNVTFNMVKRDFIAIDY